MAPLHSLLPKGKFTLNAWGLAGIFGGEEAISAMALVPLYHDRRWLGWYNSPGSLEVARHFGRLAFTRHPGGRRPFSTGSPVDLFGLDGRVGPRYTAALSGTEIPTGHLGYLAMERCKEIEGTRIPGRETMPTQVALIDLGDARYDRKAPVPSKGGVLLALLPTIVSVATCIMCALAHDWYCFSTIAFGILASGFASMTIGGSVKLTLESVRNPAPGAPPGDGVFVSLTPENIVVVIKGAEAAVNAITKGKFGLVHGSGLFQSTVAISALLLVLETLAQLFLIPQGSLFGQLMFVVSLCVSWVHNFRTSLVNREKIQADILFQKLGDPSIRTFTLGTRTTMTVFATLLTFHGISNPSTTAVNHILCTLIPNDTRVWLKWREKVIWQVCDKSVSYLKPDDSKDDNGDLTESEKELLHALLGDASAAYEGYLIAYPLDKRS